MAKFGRDVKQRFSKIEKRSTGVCGFVGGGGGGGGGVRNDGTFVLYKGGYCPILIRNGKHGWCMCVCACVCVCMCVCVCVCVCECVCECVCVCVCVCV